MIGRAAFWMGGFALLLLVCSAQAASTSVVISQVYGGGGNIGAVYKNDFIELHNRGNSSVDLNGWTIQYADSNNWQTTFLGLTLQPGQYFLIHQAPGTNGAGGNLPSPDAQSNVNLSPTSGKVALVNNGNSLSGSCPSGEQIIDLVGYGAAGCAEGNSASSTANSTALLRKSNGCTDTDNNASDFVVGTPVPRNTSSPLITCQAAGPVFTSWTRSNNAFVVQFTADPARSNIVQFSTNLFSWTVLTAVVTQVSNLFTYTDTNRSPTRLYRVLSQ